MATKPAPLATFANKPAIVPPSPAKPADAPAGSSGEKLRQKVFRLTPAQDRKLKEFCAHSDTTIQDVVLAGINMVLQSKGLPPI